MKLCGVIEEAQSGAPESIEIVKISVTLVGFSKIIEKLAVDNIPTHTTYKSKGGSYGKKKKYFSKDNRIRPPAKRPVTFLNKVGEKSEEIKKNVNGNLNKLSNQNYDKIWDNIKTIYLENKEDFDFIFYVESIFDKATITQSESVQATDNFDVHGYPCSQHPYNPMFNVQKQLPVYTKTPKSKSQFCAGYYIICFEKGWRKAYCPKMITLSRYQYKGPMKTKLEMQQVLNNAVKEFQDTNTSN